jgi:thiol-disulfide isomerase/thioredoxin
MKYLILLLTLSVTQAGAEKAPEFNLSDRSGNEIQLSNYQGKVVLIDFWASWCIPCRASFPWMNNIQSKYQEKGFEVVTINLDKKHSEMEHFLKSYPATFTVLHDPKGITPIKYKVKAMPTSYLIDQSGNIVYRHIGFKKTSTENYEKKITQLLNGRSL